MNNPVRWIIGQSGTTTTDEIILHVSIKVSKQTFNWAIESLWQGHHKALEATAGQTEYDSHSINGGDGLIGRAMHQ